MKRIEKMTYSEIVFTVDSSVVDKASAIVSMLDCGGVYIEDYTDLEDDPTVKQVGIVDEELLNKDKSKALLHIYADENTSVEDCVAFVSERFTSENINFETEIKHIDEEDYANSWKQYYKPTKIGRKIVVVPESGTVSDENGRRKVHTDLRRPFFGDYRGVGCRHG